MIEKLQTPKHINWDDTPEGLIQRHRIISDVYEKINEIIKVVKEQQQQLNNHMCRLVAQEHTEEPAEIPDTEYVTIKEDDVYVGGKPATEYNGKKIYNRYFCPAYFKEARDIIREEYGYELLEIHCLQSSTDGEHTKTGNPVADKNGTKCWVRCVYKNENATPAASLWVFNYASTSASSCAGYCARYCGNLVRCHSAMRSGLFGSVRNDVNKGGDNE